MLQNRYVWAGAVILLLLVANIIRYLALDWGLITVTVHDAPLGQIIKSIERQGGVKIYTNMDLTAPVSMYVVKVPLAEAMETLTANAGGQWKLGFFTGPSSAAVKQEIAAFQQGLTDDQTKIYNYPSGLQMLSNDDDDAQLPASDPRLQPWTGLKTPVAYTPPSGGPDSPGDNQDPPAAPAPLTTVQDYLQALAQQTDIWIMSPASWAPSVPGAPAPTSSIARAVRSLVSSAHGSVEQAIVLQARPQRVPGQRRAGRGMGGGDGSWVMMEDRVRSAINGLPVEAQPAALAQLDKEVKFFKDVQAAPADQRRDMMRQHFMRHMGANWRASPEKRAQHYAHAVANRIAATGK